MTRIPNPKAGIVRADYSSVFCVTRRFAAPRRVEPESLNLTYDAWNRLVRVTKPAGNLVAEYRYDGLNRRVLKTTSCETRRFYYNRNWQCVQETVEDQPTTHYTWGLRYVDDLVCRHTDTTPIYSLADANWNVVALTDAAGTPVERYTYNAFGKLNIYDGTFTPRSASNCNWTRTFTGQVLDNETGLMLYRNRYYAPILGRFITRDPLRYWGSGINLFRYIRNMPNYRFDPYGLCSKTSAAKTCEDSIKQHITSGQTNSSIGMRIIESSSRNCSEECKKIEQDPIVIAFQKKLADSCQYFLVYYYDANSIDGPPGFFSHESKHIYIACGKYSTEDMIRTLIHELFHASESCKRKHALERKCIPNIIEEMKAYYLAGQCRDFESCLTGAIKSMCIPLDIQNENSSICTPSNFTEEMVQALKDSYEKDRGSMESLLNELSQSPVIDDPNTLPFELPENEILRPSEERFELPNELP